MQWNTTLAHNGYLINHHKKLKIMLTIETNSFIYIAKMLNHYEERVKKAKSEKEFQFIAKQLEEFKKHITTQLN